MTFDCTLLHLLTNKWNLLSNVNWSIWMSSLSVALREHKRYKKDTLSGIEPSVIILARSNHLQLQHEGRRCRMLRPLPGLGPRFLCSSQERCGRKLKLILGETFWSSSSLVFNHCKTVVLTNNNIFSCLVNTNQLNWRPVIQLFFLKMGQSRPLFHLFSSFQHVTT